MDGIPDGVASCSVSPSVLTECGSLNRGGSDKPLFVQFWGRVGRLTLCVAPTGPAGRAMIVPITAWLCTACSSTGSQHQPPGLEKPRNFWG